MTGQKPTDEVPMQNAGMAPFQLIHDPKQYSPDTWTFHNDRDGWEQRLAFFQRSFHLTLDAARDTLVTDRQALEQAIDSARTQFAQHLEHLRAMPEEIPLTIATLDRLRLRVLASHGLQDPFLKMKHRENIQASLNYARLVKAHDKLAPEALYRVLTEGVLTGNLFDFGRRGDPAGHKQRTLDFYHKMDQLPQHPWLVDHTEQWLDFLNNHRAAVRRILIFVDNAGADFVLGCLPLARVLARGGATVWLVANDAPCYNDMTITEARAVLRALAADDSVLSFLLQTRRIRVTGMGGGIPQLDLRHVPPFVNAAAAGTGLLILVGAARAVETNWHTRFICPTLKIAVLKDEWEARQLNGTPYDLLCRFETPSS